MNATIDVLHERVRHLERHVRRVQYAAVALGATVTALLLASATRPARPLSVLRARGLVIEDARGRERILLGAPTPAASGRRRHDPATALVFLGEDGADRLTIGFTPDPQSKGRILTRVAPAVGLQINDPAGDERAGYGYLENGRVVLGLDYANGREALTASVDDREGQAALMLNGESGGFERAGIFVGRDGPSLVKVSGTSGRERLMMFVPGDSAAQLLVVDPHSHAVRDVIGGLRH